MTNPRKFSLPSSFLVVLLLLVAIGSGTHGTALAETDELFISEYIEGSSNNKAIEIYNGTGAAIDLAGYNVQMFFNGNSSVGLTINLTGTVADGDVFVLAHSSAVAEIQAQADQTNGAGWFNGDDAVVLRLGDTVIDAIGQVGFDPGSEWGSDLTSTADNTLRRKSAICAGDSNPNDAFDPALEWEGFAQNTFDGLGSHTASCDNGTGPADPVINEFVANHTGTDTQAFIEIFGDPSTDYSSFTVLEIEGDGSGAGVIDAVLPVGTTNAGGFWVALEDMENGTITIVLVENFSGSAGDDLDTDDDGVLDTQPWTRVVDDVAVSDGGSDDRTYSTTVLTPGYDGMAFAPGGASRIPNGADTDTTTDWVRNDFDGFGFPGFSGSPALGEAENTPDAVNVAITVLTDPIGECGDPATLIHDIQGSGLASDDVGNIREVEGIVTGDFEGGDQFDGFFMQEESSDQDADDNTSEGIFVFNDGVGSVNEGDTVRVRGTVAEFFNRTEISNVLSVTVCEVGTGGVEPVNVMLPVESVGDLEAYEGMLVLFTQDLYISEYFNFDRFGEIVLTTDRQFQPTAVHEPDSPEAAALAQANRLSRITLDDGRSTQNPDPAIHPNGEEFTLDNLFRGGDIVRNVIGVMDFAFSLYRIQPTAGADYEAANPRPAAPEDVGGEIEAASFNVLNYFTTLDEGDNVCGPPGFEQECRGADTQDELERQRAKIVAAIAAMDADVVGLIEIQNDEGESTADLVNALNDVLGAGTYEYIDTGFIGTDAIKQAFIYQPASVTPVGAFAVLDTPEFEDPNNTGSPKNRPALAQTFMDNASGGVFTAVVNHLKSKGSECGPGDDHPEAGSCNLTRALSAQLLVDWLATDPTGSGDADFLIIGDLNAYDKEDPIDVLRDNGYTDLVHQYQGEFAYSFVFDGQLGYLDYGMANANLSSQVTGTTVWHINADEADLIDYDMSFKQDAQDAIFAPDPFRSSDHDPVIVGLELNGSPVCDDAEPSIGSLWPPNHMFRSIDVLGVTDPEGDPFTINIDSIFQDEPVDADGSGNTAPDGMGVGTPTAEVRAERVGTGGNGRVYHISFTATDSWGGSCSAEVLVEVPKARNIAAIDDGALYDSTLEP